MNTDVRVRGLDGKTYPGRSSTREERIRARRLAHDLVCRGGLSIRAAQQAMLSRHGIRRSAGAIHADLAGYVCPACANLNT